MLGVATENLSCCFPRWLAQNQALPTSGACKAYVMCGAYDSLSSPPFLPFRVIRVRLGLSLAVPQPLKVLGGLGDLPVTLSVEYMQGGRFPG